MNLQRQQAFLAQLYTDSSLLERCLQRPDEVARSFQLTTIWIDALCQSQLSRLQAFRNSLVNKRKKQVKAVLVRSFALDPMELDLLFQSYAQQNALQNPNVYTRDAIDFGKWAGEKIRPQLSELMRYEWEAAEFFRLGKAFALKRYRYPVWQEDFGLTDPIRKRWVWMNRHRFKVLPL